MPKQNLMLLRIFIELQMQNPYSDDEIFETEVEGFLKFNMPDQVKYISYKKACLECDWNQDILQVNYPGLMGRIERMIEKYQEPDCDACPMRLVCSNAMVGITEEEHFSVSIEIGIFVS